VSIDTALYQLLTGGGIARVYPPPIPDNPTYPLVTYMQISDPRTYVQEGPDGFVFSRFQFDCWAATSSAARALAESLRAILSGYRGTSDDVNIQASFLLGGPKDYDSEARVHRVVQDYRIIFKDASVLTT
jgi:hypothetical protein